MGFKYGKWLAGGLGWAVLGPLGGLVGFALGALMDKFDKDELTDGSSGTHTGDFMVSLLVLSAAVMKADGKVLKSELDYVKQFFVQNFGEDKTKEGMLLLRQILDQKIPTEEVCQQIRDNLDYAARLQLLHYLFGISGADSNFATSEVRTIEYIAHYLHILGNDTESIKAMFLHGDNGGYKQHSFTGGGHQQAKQSYNPLNEAYTVLEIAKSATDEEVKNAYRNMARKHHPDKVSYLGEDVIKGAKEKFQQVTEAYEKIKEARGLN